MSDFFYANSPHAIQASKPQMIEHAAEMNELLLKYGNGQQLIAVNKYYKHSAICLYEGRLFRYFIQGYRVRREHEFLGYGGDAWEDAPNYIRLEELEAGQMELF